MDTVKWFSLWDAGFQLSFMAIFGLVLHVNPITNGLLRLLGRLNPLVADGRAPASQRVFQPHPGRSAHHPAAHRLLLSPPVVRPLPGQLAHLCRWGPV